MKHLFGLFIFMLFATQISFGQVAVRVFNYRPTGELGFVMKPQISVELLYQPSFDYDEYERWRFCAGLQYVNLHPRLDSIPVFGVLNDGGETVLPGVQSFQKYAIWQLDAGYDFAIVHKEKFNFFIGADLLLGATSVQYTNVIEREIDESYTGGGILVGFRGRIGVDYNITEHIGVFLNAHRNIFLVTEPRTNLNANDYGLGVRYTFD